jgi:hypothetical protein
MKAFLKFLLRRALHHRHKNTQQQLQVPTHKVDERNMDRRKKPYGDMGRQKRSDRISNANFEFKLIRKSAQNLI